NRRRNSSSDASACSTSRPSRAWCRRRKPVKYAVAGYGVLSCVIGGVTRRSLTCAGSLPWDSLWGVRLNKYLSESGACSRREADALITAGRVTINGARAVLGSQVADGDD